MLFRLIYSNKKLKFYISQQAQDLISMVYCLDATNRYNYLYLLPNFDPQNLPLGFFIDNNKEKTFCKIHQYHIFLLISILYGSKW